jgi:hypothetical protein
VKGLDNQVIVSIIHRGYLRFLVLVNTYPFFTTVLEKILGVYHDIVQVADYKEIEEFLKYIIDILLKHGRGVGQFKWHNKIFK